MLPPRKAKAGGVALKPKPKADFGGVRKVRAAVNLAASTPAATLGAVLKNSEAKAPGNEPDSALVRRAEIASG